MKIKTVIWNSAKKLLEIAAPLGFNLVKSSPRLQSLAIDALKNHDFFNRNVSVIEAGAALNRQPSPYTSAGGYFAEAVRNRLPSVSIVIPVYNAGEAFAECVTSLILYSPKDTQIVVIDDMSDEHLIAESIKRLAGHFEDFTLVTNEKNLGYTKSVNIGMRHNLHSDVILLNSDTEVTSGWITKLQYVAYSRPSVATVTPVSNGAGVFSVPNWNGEDNFDGRINKEQHAEIVERAGVGESISVPTGNGFCLFIRRTALETLGVYNETKFPRGYGEENDFCMRAFRHGFSNLVTDKVFIFHKTSQSFKGEKDALIEAGVAQVNRDFPEYMALLPVYFGKKFTELRNRISEALKLEITPVKRVLYIQPIPSGGTADTNRDLVRGLDNRVEAYFLISDGQDMVFKKQIGDGNVIDLESKPCSDFANPLKLGSKDYDGELLDFVFRHSIDLVHVEHLAWQSISWANALKAIGIPFVVTCHDYYAACPSHNLLDENYKSCGGTCTSGQSQCNVTLWPANLVPPLKNDYIGQWRESFGLFLNSAHSVITPSQVTSGIMTKVYPKLSSKISTITHGRDFDLLDCANSRSDFEPLRVLVPGNIGRHKGAELIRDISNSKALVNKVEFHFLGETQPDLQNFGVQHGGYLREEFAARVSAIRPDIALVASVWEETFCHTLNECWAVNLPVATVGIGAAADRVRLTGAGWVVRYGHENEELPSLLLELSENNLEVLRARQEVEANAWPLLRAQTLRSMADEYLDIYEDAINGRRD